MAFIAVLFGFASTLLFGGDALAAKQKAVEFYEKGTKAYEAGRFQDAIDAYEEGFKEAAAPEFLFNIAQAYRALKDCDNAVRYYKRFRDQTSPSEKRRRAVERRIRDLESDCQKQADPASETKKETLVAVRGSSVLEPDLSEPPSAAVTTTSAIGSADVQRSRTKKSEPAFAVAGENERSGSRNTLEIVTQGGAAVVMLGSLKSPPQASFLVRAAHPIELGSFVVAPGVALGMTALRYSGTGSGQGTVFMTSVLADVAVGLPLSERLRLVAEIGGGALFLRGPSDNNPLMASNAEGATLAVGRASIGVDIAITSSFFVVVPIALAASPASDALKAGTRWVGRFEVLPGLGLRF